MRYMVPSLMNGEVDPDDNREEIYVPTARDGVDLEDRMKLIVVGKLGVGHPAAIRLLLEQFKKLFHNPSLGSVPRSLVEHATVPRKIS